MTRHESRSPAPQADRRGLLGLFDRIGAALMALPRGLGLAVALAYAGFIFWMSEKTVRLPRLGFGWRSLTHDFLHAPAFGFLALWLMVALPRRRRTDAKPAAGVGKRAETWPRLDRPWAGLVVLTVGLYGVIDEVHQGFVPGRVASVFDVLTDVVGAAATVGIVAYVGRADAHPEGLRRRFLAGLLACVAAAALSSWMPDPAQPEDSAPSRGAGAEPAAGVR